ncbi:DUF1302 domain-containing protein [Zavarzinia sp. CC-PAN008]|uniref:DUF1302 domain-containing protein n=1 Tax=Zavarzinia sp. CC-PAN008 TaxID=3243332 RepID=UPI003F744ECD
MGLGLAAGALVQAPPAQAMEWTFGDVVISTQANVSAALQVRTSPRDERFVCGFNRNPGSIQGNGNISAAWGITCSEDNGNLNFDQGSIISNPITATGEVSAIWSPGDNQKFGVYVRGRAFYDWVFDVNNLDSNGNGWIGGEEAAQRDRLQTGRLDPQQQDRARYGLEAQDYYALASFDLGSMPTNIRVGNQILNWGEALVTQNAISIINPLDLQKFRTPGAEIRDGLIPIKMVWASIEPMPGLSFEGFYSWDFQGLRLEPGGTFFAGAEQLTNGSEGLQGASFDETRCGTGIPGLVRGGGVINAGTCAAFPYVSQAPTRRDQNRGDYGFAMRYFAEELNNTEFGFYFVDYQSRFLSYGYAAPGADKYLPIGPAAGANAGANAIANQGNSTTFVYYPEDVRMYGISFNTAIDEIGWAFNGEWSYKENAHIIQDNTSNFFDLLNAVGTSALAGGAPYLPTWTLPDQSSASFNGPGVAVDSLGRPVGSAGAGPIAGYVPSCAIAAYQPGATGTECAGYTFYNDMYVDAMNFNLRAFRIFQQSSFIPSMLNAESWSVIIEGAAIYADMSESQKLVAGIANSAGQAGTAGYLESQRATNWSFGYTLITNLAYPSAFGTSINLTPGLAFTHAVSGITPISGGFFEGVKSVNLSLKADYLVNLSATLNFAKSWGAGYHNNSADKDFVGLTVSYAF